MKKILYLPLDERPCNYGFPYQMFNDESLEIIRPDLSILGDKKKPGNLEAIRKFLLKESKDVDGLVLSIDMLLYGGIVPSRLHYDNVSVLTERLNVLKEIRKNNPKIKIYAFHLIMRSPQYSSSDEEPDYYEHFGREIFLTGFLSHKKELGLATEDELKELNKIKVDASALDDFLARRSINTELCLKSIELVKERIIDFLIIPQDDAAEFGWTAKDQDKVRKTIEQETLQLKVYLYPGADEVGNTLLSKMNLHFLNKRPLVYIYYPSLTSGQIIPRYEDRMLDTTVKYQILAAGGLTATSISEADIVLFVNAPAYDMREASSQSKHFRQYQIGRNLVDFVEQIDYVINVLKKPAMLGDVGFSNGGDIEFVKMLENKSLLMKVASYAGWNTSSNTLGTTIPHGILYWLRGSKPNLKSFLAARYIEDIGYCSIVRSKVQNEHLEKYNYNYFYVEDQRGIVSEIVKDELLNVIKTHFPSIQDKVTIKDIYMPWRRMFEVGLTVEYKDK